jgi:cupin fold WbuC family metalloprotein
MKVFSAEYLNELIAKVQGNPRKRQHRNIHESYHDPCQRLFNAIEPGSYICPHRHVTDPRDELLIAVRGSMALVTFDEKGVVTAVVRFGTDRNGDALAVGAEVPSKTWHTVIALEPGCVLLEVKAGPFDPSQPKNLAPWAPDEASPEALAYLDKLIGLVERYPNGQISDAEIPLDPMATRHESPRDL